MRPDDPMTPRDPLAGIPEPAPDGLLDAALTGLDAELASAGSYARRAHAGRTQPTAAFTGQLRRKLLAALGESDIPLTSRLAPRAGAGRGEGPRGRGSARPSLVQPGQAWAPAALGPRIVDRRAAPAPRLRWTFVAAAALSLALVAVALGAGLGRLLPRPVADPAQTASPAVASAAPDMASLAPIAGPPSAQPTVTLEPTTVIPAATPEPSPTPRPTARPEPTKPPVGPMELAVSACPGGVVIDWTKPSPAVATYHVLRGGEGGVPPTYPADGTTDVETAKSTKASVTDGFDATIEGGATATYRAFALDGGGKVMAWSPARTVATMGRLDLGTLVVEAAGPGSIDVAWEGADVSDGCFTYGKLVASAEDPDPSYLEGSPYLAVIGDAGATGTHVDGLPPGTTVWMRYEMIRTTSLGKFVVARTDVIQVTYP